MTAADLAQLHRRDAVRGVGVILAASLMFGRMAVCVRLATAEMPALQSGLGERSAELADVRTNSTNSALRPPIPPCWAKFLK